MIKIGESIMDDCTMLHHEFVEVPYYYRAMAWVEEKSFWEAFDQEWKNTDGMEGLKSPYTGGDSATRSPEDRLTHKQWEHLCRSSTMSQRGTSQSTRGYFALPVPL